MTDDEMTDGEIGGLAAQLVDRQLAGQRDAALVELRSLIDATYRVIARTGRFDPPIRDILAEAELSNPAFYRHFRSKDELLLLMLDEGRRQLVDYLERRTQRVEPDERVAEWVRGFLAQASDPEAARRTRPFVVETERLHERFPAEQAQSEQMLVDQLAALLGDRAAWAPLVYTLVVGELERLLRSAGSADERAGEQLVAFVLAGVEAQHPA